MRETEWKVKYTRAFRLMYIAETLINPLFSDVTFRREVMSPPPPVPSAICAPAHICCPIKDNSLVL